MKRNEDVGRLAMRSPTFTFFSSSLRELVETMSILNEEIRQQFLWVLGHPLTTAYYWRRLILSGNLVLLTVLWHILWIFDIFFPTYISLFSFLLSSYLPTFENYFFFPFQFLFFTRLCFVALHITSVILKFSILVYQRFSKFDGSQGQKNHYAFNV